MKLIAFTPLKSNYVKLEFLTDDGETRISRIRCSSQRHPARDMIRRTFFMSLDAVALGWRVAVDPETGEVTAPHWFGERRGRPPIGKRAMTDAERARRARERKRQKEL